MGTRTQRYRLVLLCVATLGLSACGDDGSAFAGERRDGDEPSSGTMSISVLPVDPGTNPFAADHLDPDGWPGRAFPPIHVFGKDYDGKVEATLMMRPLAVGTSVVAPFDGEIQEVRDQPESCDAEMYLIDGNHDQLNHASLDHIAPNPEFTKPGARFRAGQVIGTVPRWQCTEDFGGIEFMVVSNTDRGVQATCPLLLLDPSKRAAILASITALQTSWNATGAPSSYAPEEMGAGICASEHTSAR